MDKGRRMEDSGRRMSKETPVQRIVAIVGRPNVGKSALFNRLVRRRLAIVHAEEGVTRDRLAAPADWLGQRFEVVDTGGLALMDRAKTGDDIARATTDQVKVAIEDAAAVILVTDLKAGLQPLDIEVARLLRKAGRPAVVAANKADLPEWDERTGEFAALGYPVVPVSAAHNRGAEALMEAVLPHLPPDTGEAEPPRLKVAVVGRPNAGKSSYINRLAGKERVIVSEVPGTTRDTISVPFTLTTPDGRERHYMLVDTAGMRKQGRVHESVEKFSLFRAETGIAEADIVVLMLDAEEGPSTQEKKVAALIRKHRKACVVLVNKWDLARGTGVKASDYEEQMRRELFFLGDIPILFVSALSGHQIRRSFEVIATVAERLETAMPTGVLNRVIRDAFERSQPPFARGRQLKFYYAAQTGTNPPRVTLFVNNPKLSNPSHQAYLEARLREAFDLAGVPLVLRYRSSHGEPKAEAR
ncbi:MAG: ribosome biogenesis GTPase Der [Opitutae bacterium]|nr:ribosome biogenesis GTPase Der [Opitutae bacterium]